MHILHRIIMVGIIGVGLLCYCQEKGIVKTDQEKAAVEHVRSAGSTIMVAPPPATAKTIIVNNKLTLKDLPYKHWSGTHKPTELKIYVDDQLVTEYDSKQDKFSTYRQTINIPADKDIINVRHVYDWTKGGICYRQGDKIKKIKIEPDTETVDLEFSWLYQEEGKEHVKLIQNKRKTDAKKD